MCCRNSRPPRPSAPWPGPAAGPPPPSSIARRRRRRLTSGSRPSRPPAVPITALLPLGAREPTRMRGSPSRASGNVAEQRGRSRWLCRPTSGEGKGARKPIRVWRKQAPPRRRHGRPVTTAPAEHGRAPPPPPALPAARRSAGAGDAAPRGEKGNVRLLNAEMSEERVRGAGGLSPPGGRRAGRQEGAGGETRWSSGRVCV